MGRRTRNLLLLIALASVLAGIAAYLIETDEEAIERLMDECRRAALEGDTEAILSRLAPAATAGGMAGEGELAPNVRRWMDRVSETLRGVSLSPRKIVVEGNDARGDWIITATFKRRSPVRVARFAASIEYVREPEGWRVRHVTAVPDSL